MATGVVVSDVLMPDFRNHRFDFDDFIKDELKLDLNREFKRTGEGICKFYLQGNCRKGNNCQYQHTNQPNARYHERAVVCKHWLRGLCKKGDQCEFLHEFNMTKMPECWFYSRFGECSNGDECQYRHIDPDTKIKECPWYARGFCKHGPICRHKHVRKMLCLNYLTGFCPHGPACPNGHAKYELPPASALQDEPRRFDPLEQAGNDGGVNASFSGGSFERFGSGGGSGGGGGGGNSGGGGGGSGHMRNLENVTCFKCGEKGHYANRCPQGRGGGL